MAGLEGVEGLMGRLKLSAEEKKGVKIGWASGDQLGMIEPQAIGRLLSEKPAFAEGLSGALGRAWCPLKGIHCKAVGENIFLFTFYQPSGKRKALEEGPWMFDNDLLVMEDFDVNKSVDEYKFESFPIWVRIFNLPLGRMNRKTGEEMGEVIGEYIDVETDAYGSNANRVLENIQPRITQQMNEFLAREFTKEEVKVALDGIGDLKAPGADEGFSALIHDAEEKGLLSGIKLAPAAPSVNHLLFADDSLLLLEATNESANTINSILQAYEAASGQVINRDKSSILFSKNTPRRLKNSIMQIMGLQSQNYGGKYLGLPTYIGRDRAKAFAYVMEKIWKRIIGWKERFLSKAAKEILIKAVAQAIPAYAMSCFDITKSLCDDISRMICRYWWSQMDDEHRAHWVSWQNMMKPKCEGGLGFKDIHVFNLAMLARQGCRLLQAPDSLCARVLRAKYFNNGDLLSAKPVNGMSYVWRSILKGVEVLKRGVIWRVGNGANIRIWSDPWIPSSSTRGPSTIQSNTQLNMVADLLDEGSVHWKENVVRQTFTHTDAEAILKIPICDQLEDYIAWHPDSKGIFSVKSAYRIYAETTNDDRQAGSSSGGVGSEWERNIWN
ncbi:hypothetical protein QYE76_062828 [Lolium multiflorum]|uniref:DUF4283 domain-containing protein n=1 Tax=Lolium multiflorum TaxID=4521 RepID=A0AAD8S4M0_LOLMU|nr:hypothetical protein QYE76_062828 [Lolium multiflorum]